MNRGLGAARKLCKSQSIHSYYARISLIAQRPQGRYISDQRTMQAGNAWQAPGEAAFDFRSDVMTRPTVSMLEAITNTSLGDDVLQEDAVTCSLEKSVAELANHESALLVMSGTMGNQVAIRTHLTQPPYAVLCDHRGHIINYEGGGVSTWTGAYIKGIVPKNERYLTLEDIMPHAVLGNDIHGCPTRVISLENTLDGMIMPLDEMKRISEWAHANGLKVHLDGARLWEAVVAGAGSLSEFSSLADSVSLCFSKGLGAPIGSVLAGSNEFIQKARWFRKTIGGGTRQSGIIAAAAQVALNETFGSGPNGKGGKLLVSHEMARKVAKLWTEKGGKLKNPVETNMVWLDLESCKLSNEDWIEIGRQHGLKFLGGRLVVHYQISEEAIAKLDKAMNSAISGNFTPAAKNEKNGQYCGQA